MPSSPFKPDSVSRAVCQSHTSSRCRVDACCSPCQRSIDTIDIHSPDDLIDEMFLENQTQYFARPANVAYAEGEVPQFHVAYYYS